MLAKKLAVKRGVIFCENKQRARVRLRLRLRARMRARKSQLVTGSSRYW
jgi:hypothetical protein